jgi:putative ABC transport system permease protein
MALGARAADVVAWTVRAGMAPVLVGLVVGVGGALALARLVAAQLFEVSPGDPLVFASVAGLLAAVSLVASWVPARRATRVGPVAALGGD